MKRFSTIILFAVLISSNSVFAQFFIPYFPTENLEKAREEAANSLTEPRLVSLATITGTIPGLEIAGIPIPFEFDITDTESKGKSTAWIYIFNSVAEPENYQFIAIVFSMAGITPVNITNMGLDLSAMNSYISDNSLDDIEWMNSSEMVGYLKASSPYINFMDSYPEGIPQYVVLGYADFPNLDADTPYWFVTMHDEADSLLIVVNAITGDVTNVQDDFRLTDIIVYPNPAQDYTVVQLPESILQSNYSFCLFDLQGNELLRQNANNRLNIEKYANGKYFLRVSSSVNNYMIPLIINK